ncbi:MAG: hypothetical protein AABZ23_03790 [Deltaproteobacteria bacterium]
MKRLVPALFALSVLLSAVDSGDMFNGAHPPGADQTPQEIIERVIKIEGTIEKPRVIFIVPRARLWRDEFLKKSFLQDILKPVYPAYDAR